MLNAQQLFLMLLLLFCRCFCVHGLLLILRQLNAFPDDAVTIVAAAF